MGADIFPIFWTMFYQVIIFAIIVKIIFCYDCVLCSNIIIVSVWVLIPPGNNNPPIFSALSGTEKLNKSPKADKKPWQFQYGWLDIITANLLSYHHFCSIIINRTVFQYIYENCLKQGSESLDIQEGVQVCWSQYLFWVFKGIPKKDLPIFSF